jgi:hypothetical protein
MARRRGGGRRAFDDAFRSEFGDTSSRRRTRRRAAAPGPRASRSAGRPPSRRPASSSSPGSRRRCSGSRGCSTRRTSRSRSGRSRRISTGRSARRLYRAAVTTFPVRRRSRSSARSAPRRWTPRSRPPARCSRLIERRARELASACALSGGTLRSPALSAERRRSHRPRSAGLRRERLDRSDARDRRRGSPADYGPVSALRHDHPAAGRPTQGCRHPAYRSAAQSGECRRLRRRRQRRDRPPRRRRYGRLSSPAPSQGVASTSDRPMRRT